MSNQNLDLSKRLLLVVDPQVDFVTGTLPVPGADKTMKAIGEYLRENGNRYAHVIITADWHPANHSSFKTNGGMWPTHCVQHSEGAAIVDEVMQPAIECCPRLTVMTKGTDAPTEEYSIFANAVSGPAIVKMVEDNGLEGIDICGLAGDFCVLNTAKDALQTFGKDKVRCLPNLIKSIDDGTTFSNFLIENDIK